MICTKCGKTERLAYGGKTGERMKLKQLCFNCNFWDEKVEIKDHPAIVRVQGTQYVIGDENAPRAFRGHGGARFDIRFHDGRQVTSTNLWCNGEIPAHFRDLLPDNAEFNWS